MRNRLPPATGPRYAAQFRNGVWQIFDRIWYGVCGAEFTRRDAERRAAILNARKPGVRK